MQVQKTLNGFNITINFPIEELITEIKEKRQHWMQTLIHSFYKTHSTDIKSSEYQQKETIDDMIKELFYYKECPDELFDFLPFKENKLIKNDTRTIFCMDIGYFTDDIHQWLKTYDIRIKVLDELNAIVCIDDTIINCRR